MATIHVIYVPRKELVVPAETLKHLNASYAVLRLDDAMTDDHITEVVQTLAKMVIEPNTSDDSPTVDVQG
jgi:hypothetical protein